ncbi:MAG: TIGR00730 family Rossman fold protein [Thermoguttaceae bacterium]|nr:TIGR00730 family Rossman fold protein [Thermoguttaceae bacterium]
MSDKNESKNTDRLRKAIVQSPSYRRAYEDIDFLKSGKARELRLLAEYAKPESVMRRERILSTVIVFGSARILPPDVAEERLKKAEKALAADPRCEQKQRDAAAARTALKMSPYYEHARRFAEIISKSYQVVSVEENAAELQRYHVICTGGGPGIMEAANRGAFDAGCKSIGLNITLPFEQIPNPYITPELCFQFHYFAIRKLHFLLRASALVAFPGGFGTFDELFEGLTLLQTGKMQKLPIVLFGEEFWRKCVNFDYLVETGVISPGDLKLFHFVDTPEKAIEAIIGYYQKRIIHDIAGNDQKQS